MEQWQKSLLVMWIAQFSATSALSSLIAFIPLHVRHLGIEGLSDNAIWAGIIIAAAPLFATLGGPLWGVLSDRYGRKPMVMRVMFANTFVLTSMGLAATVWQMTALRALQGVFGGIGAPAMALVTSLTPKHQLAFSLGVFQSAMIVAGAVGPLMGGIIADSFGYHAVFIALGALSLFAGIIVLVFVREPLRPTAPAHQTGSGQLKAVLRDRDLLKMCVVLFVCQFGIMVVGPVLPLFVTQLGVDPDRVATTAGGIVAIAGVTSALSAFFMGKIHNKLSFRNILLFSCLGAIICFIAQSQAQTISQLFALRAVTGLFLGAMIPSANAIVALIVPEQQRGTAYGITNSANLMGIMAGPLFGGLVASLSGIRSVFWVTAVVLCCACIWIYYCLNAKIGQFDSDSHKGCG